MSFAGAIRGLPMKRYAFWYRASVNGWKRKGHREIRVFDIDRLFVAALFCSDGGYRDGRQGTSGWRHRGSLEGVSEF
ncbi:hypothetical protein CCP4SC76_2140008 [Gammaproteobacteria bacterium]